MYSGTASLCSARAAQATTVSPGRWGGRWGHPGQPPGRVRVRVLIPGSMQPPWSVNLVCRPQLQLPSVTVRPGCFTFCSLPLFLLYIPTRCNPFPFLGMLFWSLKHQKGSGVPLIPHRV